MSSARYCGIGAGAAGLAALHVLRVQGFAVDCFERTDRVGGHWHTDYESLHLITSRDVSGFDGYLMPGRYPVYPSRDQMREYLENGNLQNAVNFPEAMMAREARNKRSHSRSFCLLAGSGLALGRRWTVILPLPIPRWLGR